MLRPRHILRTREATPISSESITRLRGDGLFNNGPARSTQPREASVLKEAEASPAWLRVAILSGA